MDITSISKRYAKALLILGQEDGKFEKYGIELKDFSDFFQKNEAFRKVVLNPVYDFEDRKRLLNAILDKGGFSHTMSKFLNLLLVKKKIGVIKEITEQYRYMIDEIFNVARATITITNTPDQGTLARIKAALEGMLEKTVEINIKEDKNLIGGIIVHVGDRVWDGSVKTRLMNLEDILKRSA